MTNFKVRNINNLPNMTKLYFKKETLIDMWQRLGPVYALKRKSGPKPKLFLMDHLCVYLIWAKGGFDLDTLSTILKIKKPTLEEALERIHDLLFPMLKSAWWESKICPRPLNGNHFVKK